MKSRMKALIFGIMLLTGPSLWAADVGVYNTLQFSDNDYLNSLRGAIRAEDEGLKWGLDLQLVSYQAKLNASDKSTRLLTELEFVLPSQLILGGGIQFGYSTLDKLGLAEGHVLVGYQFPKVALRTSYYNSHFMQGASPSYPSSGNVTEPDDFRTNLKGLVWEIRGDLSPEIEGRLTWARMTSDFSFENRSTRQDPTVFISRRDGPVLSAIESVPNEWQLYELIFKSNTRARISVQHNRYFSEYRSEWSLDSNVLLRIPIRDLLTAGVGLGECSYKSQSSRYSMLTVQFQF